ncbi:amidohydrolase family protein [Cupriavidus taiwanensis]|uniref:Amidohydrolase n=1 Tax=Cupriavidus taiwanensis TaxID=164546 RepID=A0A7Z7JEF1_9BURK|nr:amidohydrolase family protein [Cupriavidus taiwanensis]SOZ09584.1 Amidohydrolase [Cupriavidus taiwanensis]SOZ11706.1 Amidohydrolase [Cupriavidus taiwanensis]SOZ43061.1 Amidohydrolase [Cupriavidus taiwanensis]SPC22307.1 Amidohydrolase [Cupriavidus taiwanensis]SPD53811.1 Amidohydrolase [Cupriavidus taiwanensis]
MIIDFRLRPPLGGFLDTLMYSAGERRDGFTRTVGFEPSPAAQQKSMDLLMQEMDGAGVDKGVVVGRLAGTLGSVSNADVEQIVREYPGRFIGAASIDPTQRVAACQTISDAIAAGFKAINIEPGAYPIPMYADDRRLYPIYAHCEDLDVPVILMVGGTAGPDLSYSDPVRTDRVLSDFPRLSVVVVHGGWPWVTEILHIAFRRPNLYLSPDMYFSRMPGWEEYVKAADTFLSDRMLYASSFPFCPVRDYKQWFETLPIRPGNLEKIMGANARRLLKL